MTAVPVQMQPIAAHQTASLATAVDLLRGAFGPDSCTPEKLAHTVAKPNVLVLGASLAGAASESGHLVGVGMADRQPDPLATFSLYGEEALALLSHHRVGYLFSMAIAPAYRTKGIGQRLANRLIAWLSANTCDLAAAASWVSGGPNPSLPLFEKLRFHQLAEISGEVYRKRNLEGRPCPVCGIPCSCSGILFVRDLKHLPTQTEME